MNNLDNIHIMLEGNRVLHVPESSSLMCYEMVQNDQLIIKGSLDCAMVSQTMYLDLADIFPSKMAVE